MIRNARADHGAIRFGVAGTPDAKADRNPNEVTMMTAVVALPNELIFISGGIRWSISYQYHGTT
jgi:hypothetical protein